MNVGNGRTIVVTGATGLQGGAVARHLLDRGWKVRAVTRNAQGAKARALAAHGADVVQGNLADPASLSSILAGAYGVFSVQNPYISGIEGEISQGKNVADAAKQTGIQHLVYGSAGTGARNTGIPSWESKQVVEDYVKSLDIPFTILRPTAFMELMTAPKFFPAASTWHLMPKLMGSTRQVVWIGVDDLGWIAAQAFAEPHQFLGQELMLASDVKSLDECRELYREVMGKPPPRFPLPAWIFKRMGLVGKDLTKMWRWLRATEIELETAPTRRLHPEALSVRAWLEKQRGSSS